MTKKTGVVVCAVLAAVVAVAVGCVVLLGGKDEAYRSIMVYQVNGSATITRANVGDMAAYENLMLRSGDSVAVASESTMRLKLDDDKYLLAEQGTKMDIIAEGDDENGRTCIDLKEGSVTSEIQNKLGPNASYEVNTPNSIMAVRGTIFRVEVALGADGKPETKLTVFQGIVSSRAVLPDGTVLDEEVLVEAGEELIIDETSIASAQMEGVTEIDYDSLPEVMQEYIEELGIEGLGIEGIGIENPNGAQNAGEDEAGKKAANVDTQANAAGEQPQAQEGTQPDEGQENEQPQADVETPEDAQEPEQASQSEEQPKTPQNPQSQQPQEGAPQESAVNEPDLTQQPQEGTPQESAVQEPQSTPPKDTPPKPQNPAPSTGDSSQGSSGGGGSKSKTQYCTVTFQYNGSTFGTQKVKKGSKATQPKLSPTQNGAWDYDFSKKVNKNITVQWVEQ